MTAQPANQKGVIYLEKNRLQIYSMAKPAVLSLEIPPAVAHDIEIFNPAEFERLLLTFLKTNAIPPTNYILVLAQNVLFEKDFAPPNPEEQKKFLDSVPFEYVSTKDFPSPQGVRVVAANSEFYTTVSDILNQGGSEVEAVIPYFSVSPQMNGLDQGVITTIIGQYAQLKQSSLVATKEPELVIKDVEAEKKAEAKKKDNKTLIYSIPVFALLIGVLGFMLLRPNNDQVTTKTKASTKPTVTAPIVSPTEIISPTSASPQPVTGKETVTTQITYDTSLAQQAQVLKNKLVQEGYAKVNLADGGIISSPKPLMVLPASLSAALKNDIQRVVREILTEITVQENQGTTVSITIGK